MATTTTTTTTLAQIADRTFESEGDGFRLQIPAGWVIEDHLSTNAYLDTVVFEPV